MIVVAAIVKAGDEIVRGLAKVEKGIENCTEHLSGIPTDLHHIHSRLGDVVSTIDPQFDERKSIESEKSHNELREKLRDGMEAVTRRDQSQQDKP
jgi:hypothetical protein